MGNLNIDVPEWVALDEWLDTNPFDFRVTGTNGEWLWRHGIYITNYPCQCSFIMAIEARMARAILGENYNFKKNVLLFAIIQSLSIAVIYYVADMVFSIMGHQGAVAPIVAVIMPIVMTILLSLVISMIGRRA